MGGQTTICRCGANAMHPPPPKLMQVKVSLEVATLDVSMPLVVALNGGTCPPHLDGG
jgi:hypothetical protein